VVSESRTFPSCCCIQAQSSCFLCRLGIRVGRFGRVRLEGQRQATSNKLQAKGTNQKPEDQKSRTGSVWVGLVGRIYSWRTETGIQHSAFSSQPRQKPWATDIGVLRHRRRVLVGRVGRIYSWRTETQKTELIAGRVDAAGRQPLPVTRYPWPVPTTAPLQRRLGWFRRTDRAGISR
jgi:hypothetical protein